MEEILFGWILGDIIGSSMPTWKKVLIILMMVMTPILMVGFVIWMGWYSSESTSTLNVFVDAFKEFIK